MMHYALLVWLIIMVVCVLGGRLLVAASALLLWCVVVGGGGSEERASTNGDARTVVCSACADHSPAKQPSSQQLSTCLCLYVHTGFHTSPEPQVLSPKNKQIRLLYN